MIKRWKFVIYSIFSLLFCSVFVSLIDSKNVNAVSSVVSGTEYHSYALCDNNGSNCSFNKTAGINFSSVPTSLLNSNSTQLRYLKGFAVEGSINQSSGSVSNSVNNVSFLFNQEGTNICSLIDTTWNTSGSYGPQLTFYSGSTVINIQNMISKSCSYSNNINTISIKFDGYTHNGSITAFNFVWGDPFNVPTTPVPAITGVCQAGTSSCSSYGGSVSYAGMVYDYTANNDSNAAIIENTTNIYNNLQQQQQQDQQDRQNITDTRDNAQNNAGTAESQNQQAMTNFFGIMSEFINALRAPATDCKVRSDLGHLDLGVLDFCSGKPPEFVPIISVAVLLVMAIPTYLICRSIIDDFINITAFAQGGDR